MLSRILITVFCLSALACADESGTFSKHVKLLAADVAESYVRVFVPKDHEDGHMGFSVAFGTAALTGGGALNSSNATQMLKRGEISQAEFRRHRIILGPGSAFSLVGSTSLFNATILGGIFYRKASEKASEKAEKDRVTEFGESDAFKHLQTKVGKERAEEFLNDLRAGVGLSRLLKDYGAEEAEKSNFVKLFREERQKMSLIVTSDELSSAERSRFLDLIAARRASSRLAVAKGTAAERAQLEIALKKDADELKEAIAKLIALRPRANRRGNGPSH